MTIFLVKGTVHEVEYMVESGQTKYEVFRLVKAESYEEAEEKFTNHFKNKSIDYGTYYMAEVDDISEMIV